MIVSVGDMFLLEGSACEKPDERRKQYGQPMKLQEIKDITKGKFTTGTQTWEEDAS